jgi:hypothetical protein
MLPNIPIYISIVFALTAIATLFLFYWALKNSSSEATRNRSTSILAVLTVWLIIQAIFTLRNIYNSNTNILPPKIFLFGVIPNIIMLIFLFLTKKGKQFIDSLPLKNITYLNVVRIPVEIVLLWLSVNKAVPELMTFEGRNFDIISGITAPFIAYFGFTTMKLNPKIILLWNFICLGLLVNITINAFLSIPSPFQKFAFSQPNIAVLNFPFVWLPTFIVPIVLLGHLTSIRQLTKSKLNDQKREAPLD